MMPAMPARSLTRLALLLALAAPGCSLVIDDPAPFPEPPDAAVEDAAPPELDFQREDAFVPSAAAPASPARRG